MLLRTPVYLFKTRSSLSSGALSKSCLTRSLSIMWSRPQFLMQYQVTTMLVVAALTANTLSTISKVVMVARLQIVSPGQTIGQGPYPRSGQRYHSFSSEDTCLGCEARDVRHARAITFQPAELPSPVRSVDLWR